MFIIFNYYGEGFGMLNILALSCLISFCKRHISIHILAPIANQSANHCSDFFLVKRCRLASFWIYCSTWLTCLLGVNLTKLWPMKLVFVVLTRSWSCKACLDLQLRFFCSVAFAAVFIFLRRFLLCCFTLTQRLGVFCAINSLSVVHAFV